MAPKPPTKKVKFLEKGVFKYSKKFKVCFIITEKKGKFPFNGLDYSNFGSYFLALGIKLPLCQTK